MSIKLPRATGFILPAFIIYLTIVIIPSLYSLYLSFFSWNGVGVKKLAGLSNYINLFQSDTVFQHALANTVLWTLLSLVGITTIALSFAILLDLNFRGRVIFRGLFYVPFILSEIVVSIMWGWIYHPQLGFINQVLESWDMQQTWLSNPSLALYAVLVPAIWKGTGAPMIMFLAGLQNIPSECLESAKIDGANAILSFFKITIPMLKETFVIVFATILIGAMKVFDIIFAMTGGGPAESTQTLATWMYKQTFIFANWGIGSAISWVLVLTVMLIAVPYVIYMTKD